MKHQLLAAFFAAAFTATVLAQQSSAPASQSAQDLPDGPQPTQAALIQPNGPTVVMDTSMGRITCQFFQKQAPEAVANFIGLANGTKDWVDPTTHKKMHGKRYYDGTTFHRVIPEFMIQGGDPTGTGMGDPGYTFNDEFDPNLNFDLPGRLAMANSGPNTNGSQFFITEQAYASLDQHYTIFGQCDEPSVNVVKTIARVQTNGQDKPLVPVFLNKVSIVPEGQPVPPPPTASGQAADMPSTPRRMIAVSGSVIVGSALPHPKPVPPPDVNARGSVLLDAVINETGEVESLHVVSGPAILRQAALDAAKTWRYRPFLLNGKAIAVKTQLTVSF